MRAAVLHAHAFEALYFLLPVFSTVAEKVFFFEAEEGPFRVPIPASYHKQSPLRAPATVLNLNEPDT